MVVFSRYTWWLAAMAGLAAFLTLASQVGALSPVQGVFLSLTSPIERGISGIFQPVANVLSSAGEIDAIREENRLLRVENETLLNENIALQGQADRVAELEQALGIVQGDATRTFVAADVISRDASAFTDVIRINRGTDAGVRPGMVVLSAQGSLLGTVTEALAGHAFVRLITDSESRVAAEVNTTGVDGIVKGTANRKLTFDFAQAEIAVGDAIVTSSLTGRFPAGIAIGRVTAVSGTPQDLFRTVELDPFTRISTARTVLVMTSFVPQAAAGP